MPFICTEFGKYFAVDFAVLSVAVVISKFYFTFYLFVFATSIQSNLCVEIRVFFSFICAALLMVV